jgi:outer membrane protein OmpA-like peptidoglycan-associated protein
MTAPTAGGWILKARTAYRTNRLGIGMAAASILLACCLLTTLAVAQDEGVDPDRGTQVRASLNRAKKEGAKGQLPNKWWDLDARLDEAEKNGASESEWQALETEVQRLHNAAVFVGRMRKQKSGMEALLGRYDQSIAEIAALYGVEIDPVLAGQPAADDLIENLNQTNFARQVLVDSLTVTNRRLNDIVTTKVVYQDSLITALQVEVSSLHQKLWETELRAGVAEADRSAAETVLGQKQEREAAITGLRSSFGEDEAEVLLTPEGTIVMRVYGLSFGIGSADLQAGQQALIAKVAAAVQRFPEGEVSIEGHTDDTGSRDANLRLSRRRAETVARILENEMGVEPESIATAGIGPDRPLALNSSAEGRARNRRIDVVITAGP